MRVSIPFNEAAIDHVTPHSKGGTTTLKKWAARRTRNCNIARGNRDDFCPDKECHLNVAQDPIQ